MTSIFISNIKTLLDRYGLSHNDLSRLSGVNQPTISRIVKGQTVPRDATVRALAKALNVDPWALRTQPIVDGETGVVRTLDQADPTTAEERRAAICPATPSCHVEPEVLLDDEKRAQAWETAVAVARDEGDEPTLTAYMPTDDLAPVVPRGALLYLAVEPYPDKPRLEPDAPAVGVVALDNGGRALVLGTPSVSLGRITLKTASGQSVPVDRIVAYVEGWAVFRRHRQP